MRRFVPVLSLCASVAMAQESNTDVTGTLYAYANTTMPRADSVLNPGNRVALLTQEGVTLEERGNIKIETALSRFTARPIIALANTNDGTGAQQQHSIYMSQWQLQTHASDGITIALGREVLNWGAGQFRSPSSPFYFDNGRSNPMRELSGVDDIRSVWTLDMQHTFTLAYIVDSAQSQSQFQPDPWRRSWLVKYDQRGEDWLLGGIVAKPSTLPAFLGGHGQITLSDAFMLYGETGSSSQPIALITSNNVISAFSYQMPPPRRATTLLGLAYTVMDGDTLSAEYVHDNRGYTAAQEHSYFQQAALQPSIALALAPPLLGRDYLNLVWQSNILETSGNWRLMAAHNLTDGSNQFTCYGEKSITPLFSLFVLGLRNSGTAQQEFASLFSSSITLGVKVAIP